MKQVYPGYQEKWISFSDDGSWIYCRYDNEADAMPVKMVKQTKNNKGTFVGNCYKMQNYFGGQPGKWVSFTTDGSWLRVVYNEADAMTITLEEFVKK